MNKLARALSSAAVLFFMLMTYLSGAALFMLGCGYVTARTDNKAAASDYTQTNAFRRATRESFDALYEAVTTGEPPQGISDDVAYFAYGLDTNILYCSDPSVGDIPAFEEKYAAGGAYVYFCRYSSDVFRGVSAVSGRNVSFEYSYVNAATAVLDGVQRNYAGTALIVAVLQPVHVGFDGYGAARLEAFILRNGVSGFFVLLGLFLLSFAVVLANGPRRRRIDRRIADAVAWLYLELRFAALGAVLLLCVRSWSFPPDYRFTAVIALLLVPALYVLRCNVKYNGGSAFFKRSALYHLFLFIRSQFDAVVPLTSMQRGVRMRAVRLALFGLALPLLLFFAADLVLGSGAVRLMIPFYLFYFAVLFALFYKKYAELVNGLSELERLSALLPLGERIPDSGLDESDPLYPLAKNINAIDEAVNAQAEMKFKHSHKKLAQLSGSISELKEQLRQLDENVRAANAASDGASYPLDIYVSIKRLTQIADTMFDTVMQNLPVTAPVLKRMDLLPVLDEVTHARLPEMSAAQITIDARLPSSPVLITADPRHIRAVLDILYGNLAMYALAGSTVDMQIRKEGDAWRFVMVNTVSPAVSAESAPNKISTGLALAREYLALNGGSIEYSGKDNRFGVSFVLPAAH